MNRRRLRSLLAVAALVGIVYAVLAWQMRADAQRAKLNAALSAAVAHGDVREIRRLVDEGADPNVREQYRPVFERRRDRLLRLLAGRPQPFKGRGLSPLMVAAAYEDLELVKKLLER